MALRWDQQSYQLRYIGIFGCSPACNLYIDNILVIQEKKIIRHYRYKKLNTQYFIKRLLLLK